MLRLAYGVPSGSGNLRTSRPGQPTRTIAFWPPSVIHAALSGPWITPCGAEPRPSATSSLRPDFGSNQPRWPLRCAVNHTPPSGAGATSWMPAGRGVPSGHDCSRIDSARPALGQAAASPAAPKARSALRRDIVCMRHLRMRGDRAAA